MKQQNEMENTRMCNIFMKEADFYPSLQPIFQLRCIKGKMYMISPWEIHKAFHLVTTYCVKKPKRILITYL